MEKLDLTKADKVYYTAKTKPHIVNIDAVQYLSIVGKGDPSGEDFAKHIEALYSTAYTIKFEYKTKNKDFVVAKLEGLWWYDKNRFTNKTIDTASSDVPRSEWEYRLLIRMPDYVTQKDMEKAVRSVVEKRNIQLASRLEFFEMNEGKCVHMMHVGPFADEPKSLKIMGAFMEENDLKQNGLHHEIYLSDFRKTAPGKLKTILREPVK